MRYWGLLLVTLILNIILIADFNPSTSCPVILNTTIGGLGYEFLNGTELDELDVLTSSLLFGCIYAILVLWMLIEHFSVTLPHFVLPELLYTISRFILGTVERYFGPPPSSINK